MKFVCRLLEKIRNLTFQSGFGCPCKNLCILVYRQQRSLLNNIPQG